MKKGWQKPELEILDVSETMLQSSGNRLDAPFSAGTHLDDLTLS